MKISFWSRLIDIIAPRACVICGNRLAIAENTICTVCNMHIPRTQFFKDPYNNEMAKLFWGQIPIEKGVALFYYEGHSQVSNIIYTLKYGNQPDIGVKMGRIVAKEYYGNDFFNDIDMIIPIPLAKKRLRKRGYNQSMEIAKGVNEITDIPIAGNIVSRQAFVGSQTDKDRWGRMKNVEGVFHLDTPEKIRGKHLLIIDDVVTTGATVISCAKELTKAGNVKISVLSLGFAKS